MGYHDIQVQTELVKESGAFVHLVYQEIEKALIGQKTMVNGLLLALLADGHVLMEGLPGLAKTTAIKALAQVCKVDFSRIQFTPDLLPADLVGTQIYEQKSGEFRIKKGPLFSNFVLADEINRAPAKVQSALLETMQEKQITIGGQTFLLPEPFLVLATQNPIEQEGTYPLPEAQVDRFLLKILVQYPTPEEELEMLQKMGQILPTENNPISPILLGSEIIEARKVVDQIYVNEALMKYMVDLVTATRQPEQFKIQSLQSMIAYGASPRASLSLLRCAKAQAFLNQRGFVVPQDVKDISYSVLRHRILLSYEAEAEEMNTDQIIKTILEHVPTP